MISNFKKKSWVSTVISLTLIFMVGLIGLTGCNSSEKKVSSKDSDKDILSKVSNYLVSNVPEIKKIKNMTVVIDKEPNAKAQNQYEKDYYLVSVGQNSSQKFTTIDHFYVSKNLNKVLWYDVVSGGKIKSIDKYRKAKSEAKSNVATSQVYKSKNLGLALTFPKNWSGKYRVKEDTEGLFVYFKPTQQIQEEKDGQGLYFCILKKSKNLNESFYDSVLSNGKREINVNGTSYFVGGPTDVDFSENHPEFNTFIKLQAQVPNIIKSVKSIK